MLWAGLACTVALTWFPWCSSHRSQGYGTVRFTTKEAADAAVARYNGTDLEGRTLAVFIDRFN